MPPSPESPDDPQAGTARDTDLADASTPEVGQQLALSQDHLRGLHVERRVDCWRCTSTSFDRAEER